MGAGASAACVTETVKASSSQDLLAITASLPDDVKAKLKNALGGSASTASKKYKLQYFAGRGVAEVIRMLFAVAKVDYEDARFSLTFGTPGDFSTIQRPEFDKAKAEGILDPSMGKVPLLFVDGGVPIPQSKAIERYLAKEFGLMGTSSIEGAQIDAVCEHIRDIKDAYQGVRRTPADTKEAAMKKFFDESLPENCAKLEKSLPKKGGPFLFGEKISLADISVFNFLWGPKGFFDNVDAAKAAVKPCPRLLAACEATAANAGMQAWLANRPDTFL